MKNWTLVLLIFLGFLSKASHNRSGEIIYKRVPPYTKIIGGSVVQAYWFAITVIKYTDDDTQPLGSTKPDEVTDRCADTVYFGDGTRDYKERMNGGTPVCLGCKGCDCTHCGELIIDENGYRVKKNIYEFLHEYPAAGTYKIRTTDPNRNADVINMRDSETQIFYLESVLVINSFTGPNSSPTFTVDPVDKACLGKCFTHNPGVYDSDRDKITYEMSTPRGADGKTVIGYLDPEVQPGGTFNIDPNTGTLSWCNPTRIGEYNIAFIVKEWRKNTSNEYQMVGSVLRDMQVVVRACPNNDPPVIVVPKDTCVEAGTFIAKKIKVSDPNSNDKVKLTGHGGAFSAPPPVASLANTSGNGFSADFTWQTSCEHVALEPYRSTFRAEDNAGSEKMSNYKVYSIYVLPSAVKNVTAVPVGSDMNISWSLSSCFSIVNAIESYKIYRREGCAPFLHEPCQTGVAAESGFVFIGKTDNKTSGFTDDNAGDGLVVGQNYSYIVVAIYADGVESFASAPVCAKLKRDIPVVLNVDVLTTSATSGSVQIRWSRPLKTEGNLDTVALPGNYRFDLKYKSGSGYKTIFSSTAKYLFQLDTNYIHSPVNTTVDSNEYHVEFTAKENVVVGSSQKATSVFLNALGSDRKVELSWKSKTPWKNTRYTVFRKDPFSSGFSAIGTSTTNSFKDENRVANRNTYCYYVLAEGAYSDPTIYSPLLNRSQQVCVTPQDKTPPCTPTLSVDADCPSGFITVQWKNVRPICSDDVTDYLLYYKSTIEEPYAQILKTDSTYYQYDGSDPIAGCYAINAVDSAGNLSALSPDFCIDICPEFELPNIFSPNKDGANDFFKAVKVRQVKEIELVILDRWGNIVYKTKDPYFQWDGTHIQSKQAVSDGTFLYVCAVYEARVKGLVKRILKGTVQAVR